MKTLSWTGCSETKGLPQRLQRRPERGLSTERAVSWDSECVKTGKPC